MHGLVQHLMCESSNSARGQARILGSSLTPTQYIKHAINLVEGIHKHKILTLVFVASTFGMTQAQHPHAKEEWDKVREVLEELYLCRNMTLDQVVVELKQRGFQATSRQYKTKLKAWNFDDKKIKGDIWMAMSIVMETQTTPTSDMVFKVPIRGSWIRYVNSDAINKQMRRSKEPKQYLSEAWANLQLKGIEIMTNDAAREDFQRANANQRASFDSYGGDLIRLLPTSCATILPPIKALHHSEISPAAIVDANMTVLDTFILRRPTVAEQLPSIQTLISSIHPSNAGYPLINQSWDSHNRFEGGNVVDEELQAVESIRDHDFVSALSMLSMDPSCDQETKNGLHQLIGKRSALLVAVPDEDKMLATRWAAYYILKSLSRNDENVGPQDSGREAAIGAFRTMLDKHNRFIFSYCHWMVAVLVSNEKMDVVHDFLSDCCKIIDHHPSYRQSSYRSHFHFTLASYQGDQGRVAQHSQVLEVNTNLIGMISGYRSPNYLINQYNLAWHKLNEQHYNDALHIMSRYLPISEQIMGPTHMVTITCLAMLSRAHTEMGDIPRAISCLEDALGRLVNSAEILQAYKYRLLRRLAVLQIQMNDVKSAEHHLLEIIHFRILHFGIASDSTWNAIAPLIDLLNSQGRRADAESLSSTMVRKYDQELQRQHLKDHDTHAPWVCSVCYRPRDSLECCTTISGGVSEAEIR